MVSLAKQVCSRAWHAALSLAKDFLEVGDPFVEGHVSLALPSQHQGPSLSHGVTEGKAGPYRAPGNAHSQREREGEHSGMALGSRRGSYLAWGLPGLLG